jgi:hypothetical protein
VQDLLKQSWKPQAQGDEDDAAKAAFDAASVEYTVRHAPAVSIDMFFCFQDGSPVT